MLTTTLHDPRTGNIFNIDCIRMGGRGMFIVAIKCTHRAPTTHEGHKVLLRAAAALVERYTIDITNGLVGFTIHSYNAGVFGDVVDAVRALLPVVHDATPEVPEVLAEDKSA